MEVIRTIQPGKPGSVRFHRRWKDRLVAVALGVKSRIVYGLVDTEGR